MSSPEIITRVKVTSNKTIQDILKKKWKINKTNKQKQKTYVSKCNGYYDDR